MLRGSGQLKVTGKGWARSCYAWKEGSQKVTQIEDPAGSSLLSEYAGAGNYVGHTSNYAHKRSPNYQKREETKLHDDYKSTFAFGDGSVKILNVYSDLGTAGTPGAPHGIWTTLSND